MRPPILKQEVPCTFWVDTIQGEEVYEITIIELQNLFDRGVLTATGYTAFCLERIQKVDPFLESIIEVNPDAMEIALKLDSERRSGRVRSMLHGVPVIVKDNMATKDKMQTTAGSWALLGSKVPKDAFVIAKLREAGAIILGHANMSEWASVRSKIYSTSYSPRGGQVRNSFNLSSSPFGSSGGSAVTVSSNIVPLSFGTETDTSIIGPAQINGVVGIKPTVGLTSRAGIIPVSESLDTVGTFGRTVLDAVQGLNAIAGKDYDDQATQDSRIAQYCDYTSFISSKIDLKGAKFGLPIKRCWDVVPKDQKQAVSKILDAITATGAEIIPTEFPCAEERIQKDGAWNWEFGVPSESEFTIVKVEAYNGINEYLSKLSETDVKTLEDIVAYNLDNRGSEGAQCGDHPAFPSGQDNFEEILECKGIDAALCHRAASGEVIMLDALIMSDRKGVGQQMAAQAGYPIITIPVGLDAAGISVGMSLHQTAFHEGVLVKWASAIEEVRNEVLGWRPMPKYHFYHSKNVPIGKSHTT
ncbi:amidase signature enzyme [Viridothelium virens]|uniref:Amidase signature enzyme n=1 Tax=Viridothelium virens TaxID=1048519 RepID=A0A6A6GYZ4_VIRVR|nr:amidase signature enzyme [Viridothelium virens]